jgi:hypothetical protein
MKFSAIAAGNREVKKAAEAAASTENTWRKIANRESQNRKSRIAKRPRYRKRKNEQRISEQRISE